MAEKSSVRFVLKRGVSKSSEMGFEIEVIAVEGATEDSLKAIGELAVREARRLMNTEVPNG